MARIQEDRLFYTSSVIAPSMAFLFDHTESVLQSWAHTLADRGVRRLYAVGGGASLSAMTGLEHLLSRCSGLDVRAMNGWQFAADTGSMADAALLATSYSGQTPEVLAAVRRAKEAGAWTMAFTDGEDSPLAHAADAVVTWHSKAVYIAPLTAAYLLGSYWMQARGEGGDTVPSLLHDLHHFPEQVPALLPHLSAEAEALAGPLASHYYVLASGPQYGLGYKLALSVIIENLWTNATILQTGEFYHGPIEIVEPDGPTVLILLGEDAARPAGERVRRFLENRGAPHLVFDSRRAGTFSEWMAPYPLFMATELWVMWMAARLGHDVDERRYMGKTSQTWGEF